MDATRLVLISSLTLLSILQIACGQTVNSADLNGLNCPAQATPKSFLVQWKDQVPAEFERYKLHQASQITRFSGVEKAELEKTLAPYREQVAVAEHEFKLYLDKSGLELDSGSTCDSSALPSAWGPTDIQAAQAWSYGGKQGEGITVAVVDSGVDITHSLLSSQIWSNAHEVPNNSIDDDKNGYIDDYMGFDFADSASTVIDGIGHGTHVSGIIAGQPGPLGFTGVAPKAKILPLKFMDSTGAGNVGDAIIAMEYALANGARVINASWGGSDCSDILKQEIAKVASHGTVFVSAAGNGDPVYGIGRDLNNPNYTEWPAAFVVPGKITVGSMNQAQNISSFSNFGSLVDLVAPGETILSTVPPGLGQTDDQLCPKSGTSMATPFVAGVSALLLSIKPTASPVEIANAINSSVVPGRFGVRTGGKLNALGAVQYILSH